MSNHRAELRRWKGIAAVLAIALFSSIFVLSRSWSPEPVIFSEADFRGLDIDRSDKLRLKAADFSDLPGWKEDRVSEVLPALVRSCRVFVDRDDEKTLGKNGLGGTAGDWQTVCGELLSFASSTDPDEDKLREWIQESFDLWQVTNRGRAKGLFTGYYEASLKGSRRRHGSYLTPLYRRPPELATVDLGAFREEFTGRKITGKVDGSTFVPFADRSRIDEGALRARRLELVWIDDPVDAFFLQIQGSGRVQLDDGGELRVGYAGQNGHPYFAIGRELIDRGAVSREKMSMQAIRDWLEENPGEVSSVLQMNASYVFFQALQGEGPLGSLGVAVTPGRSLAVDRNFLPLGVPLFLDSEQPVPFQDGDVRPLRRLMVAQDTGGAIKGPVRGDVFWGHGEVASETAGRMKEEGRLWILLPMGMKVPEDLLVTQ